MNQNKWRKITIQPKIQALTQNQFSKKIENRKNVSYYSNMSNASHDDALKYIDDCGFSQFITQLQNQAIPINIQESPESVKPIHKNINKTLSNDQDSSKQYEQSIIEKLYSMSVKQLISKQSQGPQKIIHFNQSNVNSIQKLRLLKQELIYLKKLFFTVVQLLKQTKEDMYFYKINKPMNFMQLLKQFQRNRDQNSQQKISNLQSTIKQKDIQINSLIKQIQKLSLQNQKLNEQIFDIQQKEAQIDIQIENKVKQILKKKQKKWASQIFQKNESRLKYQKNQAMESYKKNIKQKLKFQLIQNQYVGQNQLHKRQNSVNQAKIQTPQSKFIQSLQNSQIYVVDSLSPNPPSYSKKLIHIQSFGSKTGFELKTQPQIQTLNYLSKNVSPKSQKTFGHVFTHSSGQLLCLRKDKYKKNIQKDHSHLLKQTRLNKTKNYDKISSLGNRIDELRNQIRKQIISTK